MRNWKREKTGKPYSKRKRGFATIHEYDAYRRERADVWGSSGALYYGSEHDCDGIGYFPTTLGYLVELEDGSRVARKNWNAGRAYGAFGKVTE